jgi:hypothetical protein
MGLAFAAAKVGLVFALFAFIALTFATRPEDT